MRTPLQFPLGAWMQLSTTGFAQLYAPPDPLAVSSLGRLF